MFEERGAAPQSGDGYREVMSAQMVMGLATAQTGSLPVSQTL